MIKSPYMARLASRQAFLTKQILFMRSTYGRFACKEFSLYLKCLLSVLAFFTLHFTLAVSLALCTDVVAKHCSEDEVLFRCQLIQRTGNE